MPEDVVCQRWPKRAEESCRSQKELPLAKAVSSFSVFCGSIVKSWAFLFLLEDELAWFSSRGNVSASLDFWKLLSAYSSVRRYC